MANRMSIFAEFAQLCAFSFLAAVGCADQSNRDNGAQAPAIAFSRQGAGACSNGQTIDSAFIARKATEVFTSGHVSIDLAVHSYEPVGSAGVEEGVLVRLIPRGGRQLGGGGLAYVDVQSGCAIALRSYE